MLFEQDTSQVPGCLCAEEPPAETGGEAGAQHPRPHQLARPKPNSHRGRRKTQLPPPGNPTAQSPTGSPHLAWENAALRELGNCSFSPFIPQHNLKNKLRAASFPRPDSPGASSSSCPPRQAIFA